MYDTREFRVYGWNRIIEELPDGQLKKDLQEAICGLRETSSLAFDVTKDEARLVDEIAADRKIGPHDIPDLGHKIIGLGNPKKHD